MGGKSSSSNSTTDNSQNNSSQVGVSGDNDGVVISGLQDSNVTVTDHGSVEAAIDLANNALDSNSSVVEGAFSFGETSLTEAYSFGESAIDSLTHAMRESSMLASESMQFANTINASKNTNGASDLAEKNNKLILALFAVFVLMTLVIAIKVGKS